MANKKLITIIFTSAVFVLSFFIWHFFLSIYEIKIESNPKEELIAYNSKIQINVIGLNSLGWRLGFRNALSNIEILNGNELIEKKISNINNYFEFETKDISGEIRLKINSKLALNPTILRYRIIETNL